MFFSTGLQNLHSTCTWEHSEEKMFSFLTSSFLLVLRIWPVNFSTFIQKLFVSLVKTAFHVSRATIWSKLNISRNKDSTTFRPWMKNILTCWWKTPALLSDLHSPVPATFRGNLFSGIRVNLLGLFLISTNLFYFFPRHFSSWFSLCPGQHFVGRLHKRKNIVPLLSDVESNFSEFWRNIFLRGYWNRFHVSRRTFLW